MEKSGNAVTPTGNPFTGTAREYFSEKIHWLDESLASKQAARERNFRCNFRAGIRAIRARRKRRQRRTRKKKKKIRRGIGNVSTTYNRQGVDSRLLDLRQSNFANETYPVTQLASTQRAHARMHVN